MDNRQKRDLRERIQAIPEETRLRACLENGWHGRLARPGWRPADRNGSDAPHKTSAVHGFGCPGRSVGQVARRHRLVARATRSGFFKKALRQLHRQAVSVQSLAAFAKQAKVDYG